MRLLLRLGSGLVALLALGLGCLEAYLRWELHAAASATSELRPLETLAEESLSREDFYQEYVLKRRPVKLKLAQPDQWNMTEVVKRCGNHRSNLISSASWDALRMVRRITWLRLAFEWVCMPMLGKWTTLDEELLSRVKVALGDYVQYMEHTRPHPGEFSLGLPLFLTRVMPIEVLMMLDYFGRPRYLHDEPLARVCEEVMENLTVPRYVMPNWFFVDGEELAQQEVEKEPTIFMGRAHSMSYPMHQNIMRHDFFLSVYQGRKRFSIFEPSEHHKLNPVQLPGADHVSIYQVDAFAPDLVAAPRFKEAQGWAGFLEPGELIYVPGDFIHSFENFDFKHPTVALKFWYQRHEHHSCGSSTWQACADELGLAWSSANLQEYLRKNLQARAKKMENAASVGRM